MIGIQATSRMDYNLHEENCQEALDGLIIRSHNLVDLSNMVVQDARCREDDHLGFMGLCFVSRQIDHVQCLAALGQQRDAMLIARSMIEGLCMLKWAAQSISERPLMWRAFGYVHNWRTLCRKVESGEAVDPLEQTKIESGLATYGHLFYTNNTRRAQEARQDLPSDPYHKDWKCGTQIKQICESVGGSVLHQEIYSTYSDWHHWGISTMAETISLSGDTVCYRSSSASRYAMALATGFQCLIETVELVNQHLALEKELQIAEIRDDYLKWHRERGHPVEGSIPST
jgi:hypothetical protein